MISWKPDSDRAPSRADAAVLLAIAVARQAASPTAHAQARLPARWRRTGAAFTGTVAISIAGWG